MENKRLKAAALVLSVALFATGSYTAFEKIKYLEIEVKLLNQIAQQKDELMKAVKGQMQLKEEELGSATNELNSTKNELGATKSELSSTKNELNSARNELGNTKKELEDTKKNLVDTIKDLDSTKNELDNAIKEIDIAKKELESIKQELVSIKKVQEGIRIQLDSENQKPEILMPKPHPLKNNSNT